MSGKTISLDRNYSILSKDGFIEYRTATGTAVLPTNWTDGKYRINTVGDLPADFLSISDVIVFRVTQTKTLLSEIPGAASGTTSNRPVDVPVGTSYFDTTLGMPVYFKEEGVWVDSTGTTV